MGVSVTKQVAVLLSTFNPGSYVEAQLDSLFQQTFTDFTIYIRDDGSDSPHKYLQRKAAQPRIQVVEDSQGNIGPGNSFLTLLEAVEADIYFFCDQDDVWFPDKVSRAVSEFESQPSNELVPRLYHTGAELVDRDLNSLGIRYHPSERLVPGSYVRSDRIFLESPVLGCSAAFNRCLRNLVVRDLPINRENIILHDWWVALYASFLGETTFDPAPSLYYRQHANNVSGSSAAKAKRVVDAFAAHKYKRVADMLARTSAQAELFCKLIGERAAESEYKRTEDCGRIVKNPSFWGHLLLWLRGQSYANFRLRIAVLLYLFASGARFTRRG